MELVKSAALAVVLKDYEKTLNNRIDQLRQHMDDYRSKAEDKSLGDQMNRVADSLADDIQILLNGIQNLPTAIGDITTVSSAQAFIYKAKRCTEAMSNNLENIKSTKESQSSKADRTKEGLDNTHSRSSRDRLQTTLAGYLLGVRMSSSVISATTAIFDTLAEIYPALEYTYPKVETA